VKIAKIINNNVISVINEQQKELIIMGKGIGFQAKSGDPVDKTKIEKIFTLNSQETTERFRTLLREVPIEVMEVTEQIIQHAKMAYKKDLNDIIYVALTDHINFAIERVKKGYEIKNALLWEIRKLYQDEFAIGQHAIEIIEKKLGITLPEDEAAFIALHIVNAELNEEVPNVINITKLTKHILKIVKYHFNTDLDEDSLNYFRFITHLKFFCQRLINRTFLSSDDDTFFDIVKEKHKDSFACTEKIKEYIKKQYDYELTNEEMLYLTIHIDRVIHR
jgi:beta-glucoside operon transcriptional antiterminator